MIKRIAISRPATPGSRQLALGVTVFQHLGTQRIARICINLLGHWQNSAKVSIISMQKTIPTSAEKPIVFLKPLKNNTIRSSPRKNCTSYCGNIRPEVGLLLCCYRSYF